MTLNCTGKPTGGPKLKRSTRTRACAQRAFGDGRLDVCLHPLARLDVPRDDDDLRERLIGLHRLQAEPEARRALPDIGRVGRGVGIAGDDRFGLFRRLFAGPDRGALGKPQLEKQLGTFGEREELLLNLCELAEAEDR